jgi:hypothetical protein
MTTEDKQTVSAFASKTFSAKNVADMVIASLLDAPIVEKYRRSNGKDIDAVDDMQHRDAGVAWAGVTKRPRRRGGQHKLRNRADGQRCDGVGERSAFRSDRRASD